MLKRNILVLLSVVMIAVLAGCGNQDSTDDRRALVGLQLCMEEQAIPFPEERTGKWSLLGMQFYQGEPVQIWGVENPDGATDVYLFHEDGSREDLLTGAPSDYGSSEWFLDREGHCILLQRLEGNVIRLDGRGGELYRNPVKDITDICQLPDGRIIVITREDSGLRLGELHCDTGAVTGIDTVNLGKIYQQFIGAGKSGLLLMDTTGLWEINLKNGERECMVSFDGFYNPGYGVRDFRTLEDGRLEVLQSGGKLQKLELVNPAENKDIIIVRGSFFDSDMKQCAILFNQANEKYYVYLEECPEDSDRLDFGNRTLTELGTGGGPDIICSPLLAEEIGELIGNGYVEDLAPWIEKAGIREEDYFPGAFAYPRDGDRIYGVNRSVMSGTCYISRAVLGDQTDPDIEAFVDALAGYDGEGVFAYMSAQRILQYFLEGSGDLWGMLDWEAGSCRFDGELFADMLRVAARYADDREVKRYGHDDKNNLFESGCHENFYCCEYDRRHAAEKGMAEIGYFFDDGRHGMHNSTQWTAITSTSPYKEGAWEFIQFLLSDQCQEILHTRPDWGFLPVSRKCFDEMAGQAIARGVHYFDTVNKVGRLMGQHQGLNNTLGEKEYREIFGPTEAKVEQVRRALEDAHVLPLKTAPILNFIYEEAEAYFSGAKSIEEVTPLIQNRVQLYLDEHR